MKKMLANDQVGPYSNIRYGTLGEIVEVISTDGIMSLVEGKYGRFHVRMENLTDPPTDETADSKESEATPMPPDSVSKKGPAPKKKGKTKPVSNQKNLF